MQAVAAASPAHAWSRPAVPRTATLGARTAALALDLVVLALLTFAVWKAAGVLGWLPRGGVLESYGFLLLAEPFVGLVYFTTLEGARGASLGKALVGLRVVRAAGGAATPFAAFVRNLLRFVWMTPVGPVFLLLDAFLVGTTEMEQRLGDLAAGTIVVEA